jgi:F0F1-type ATP synthase epsilon subunit
MRSAESEKLAVEVATPGGGLVFQGQANAVTFEAKSGQTQILPGHQDMLTLGEEGTLRIETGDVKGKVVFNMQLQIAEVVDGNVRILAERAEQADLTAKTHSRVHNAVA